MKILLVGEYSMLHNSLKEGLIGLGNRVDIIGTGDNFKNLPIDFSISPTVVNANVFTRTVNKIFFKIFNSDLCLLEKGLRFYFHLPKLRDYDVVQLINSNAIETYPWFSRYLLGKVFRNNAKINFLVCGEETPVIEYLMLKRLKYSILTEMLEGRKATKFFMYSIKYLQKKYRKTFEFVARNAENIIVSDLDYKICMEGMGYCVHFIPNPINVDRIEVVPVNLSVKVVIYLGVNTRNCIKKGVVFFEKALDVIKKKYLERVEIIVSKDLPYKDYVKNYEMANILLDQVYSYDQGYNALEAMAKGKVVFTGAEVEFYEYFGLEEKVNINALPDVDFLVDELSYLIENPDEIEAIGQRARRFIEKEHNYVAVATKYLEVWGNETKH